MKQLELFAAAPPKAHKRFTGLVCCGCRKPIYRSKGWNRVLVLDRGFYHRKCAIKADSP